MTRSDCLFCRIIAREVPASIVYEDERVLAFNDINPQGPTHVLLVPKRHVASLNDLGPDDDQMVGDILDDVEAGHRAGCRTVLLSPGGETEWYITPDRMPDFFAPDLLAAAKTIKLAARAVEGARHVV